MGWLDYYRLLERYEGDLSQASAAEMREAAAANPNDPPSARALAERKYGETHERA